MPDRRLRLSEWWARASVAPRKRTSALLTGAARLCGTTFLRAHPEHPTRAGEWYTAYLTEPGVTQATLPDLVVVTPPVTVREGRRTVQRSRHQIWLRLPDADVNDPGLTHAAELTGCARTEQLPPAAAAARSMPLVEFVRSATPVRHRGTDRKARHDLLAAFYDAPPLAAAEAFAALPKNPASPSSLEVIEPTGDPDTPRCLLRLPQADPTYPWQVWAEAENRRLGPDGAVKLFTRTPGGATCEYYIEFGYAHPVPDLGGLYQPPPNTRLVLISAADRAGKPRTRWAHLVPRVGDAQFDTDGGPEVPFEFEPSGRTRSAVVEVALSVAAGAAPGRGPAAAPRPGRHPRRRPPHYRRARPPGHRSVSLCVVPVEKADRWLPRVTDDRRLLALGVRDPGGWKPILNHASGGVRPGELKAAKAFGGGSFLGSPAGLARYDIAAHQWTNLPKVDGLSRLFAGAGELWAVGKSGGADALFRAALPGRWQEEVKALKAADGDDRWAFVLDAAGAVWAGERGKKFERVFASRPRRPWRRSWEAGCAWPRSRAGSGGTTRPGGRGRSCPHRPAPASCGSCAGPPRGGGRWTPRGRCSSTQSREGRRPGGGPSGSPPRPSRCSSRTRKRSSAAGTGAWWWCAPPTRRTRGAGRRGVRGRPRRPGRGRGRVRRRPVRRRRRPGPPVRRRPRPRPRTAPMWSPPTRPRSRGPPRSRGRPRCWWARRRRRPGRGPAPSRRTPRPAGWSGSMPTAG